jgi:hypothetical protein
MAANTHFNACLEYTHELNLMLRYELGKCHENGRLYCHLAMVFHTIAMLPFQRCPAENAQQYVQEEICITRRHKLNPVEGECDKI